MLPEVRTPRRVLIIEDDADSREVLRELLIRSGHQVDTAMDGVEGIALARRNRPDTVLLDLGLPVMDGWEVGQRVRALYGAAVRLIAVTGSDERARIRAAGFDGYLRKPMSPAQLLQAVDAT